MSRVLLSREMGHYLLRIPLLSKDKKRDQIKRSFFGRPFFDAFLFHDKIVVDPTVGVYHDFLEEPLRENDIYQYLIDNGIVEEININETMMSKILDETREQTLAYIEFLQAIRASSDVFADSFDYMLESPLSYFVRETEAISGDLSKLSKGIGLRGSLPFIFSCILSIRLHTVTGIPVLFSPKDNTFLSTYREFDCQKG